MRRSDAPSPTPRRARTASSFPASWMPSTIARLVQAIGAPVNVMASYGAPSVGELAGLGVARVSVGPAITRAAMATIRAAARELLGTGTYDALVGGIPFAEANALFSARGR